MKYSLIALVSLATLFSWGEMKSTPCWDLAKDKGVKEGMPLSTETAFSIPHQAIPNHSAFTATATLRFGTVEKKTHIVLFDQRTADTGWSLSLCYFPAVGSPVTFVCNGETYSAGWFRAKPGETHTITITARKGIVVIYEDDHVFKRFFKVITPNLEPIWVGRTRSKQEMKNVTLCSLRFYGPDEEYYAKGESHEFATGYKGGKGWLVEVPSDESKPLPRLLYYGDSISSGYKWPLQQLLKGKAYSYHWSHFLSNPNSFNEKAFLAVAKLAPYDMIVFNNGLHSLHWTKENTGDEQIRQLLRNVIHTFRKGAPQAKLVWLSTTPHTARRASPGEKISSTGKLNDVVIRINTLAKEVMDEENVEIIDGYGMLIHHLDLAAGDEYHWKGPAYKMLAQAIADCFFESLKKK